MAAQLLDGKQIGAEVRAEVRARAERFAQQSGRKPGLALVLVGDDPASRSYVASKERACEQTGVHSAVQQLAATCSERELLAHIDALNSDPTVDGVLVQLPLPSALDTERILRAVAPHKDVDGLHPTNVGLLASGHRGLRPCTPLGCMRMLAATGVELAGKRALVIGRSNLVGKPMALLLLEQHCTVTIAHSHTRELAQLVAESDVLVSAAGVRGLVRGEWVKPGSLVLDVGLNRGPDQKLVGDVEFEPARERAAWITPVPGGVGLMTVAMLLANTVEAAEQSMR